MSEHTNKSPSRYASTPGRFYLPQTKVRSHALNIHSSRDMTSEVFELVSRDNVRFFVHQDILTSQSKPFRQATTGPWQEASERKIVLNDWDTDTVARLVEFLYSNNYPYPDPDPLEPVRVPQAATSEPGEPNTIKVDAQPGSSRPLTPFDECLKEWMPRNSSNNVTDLQRLGPCDPAKFDYESVLLLHARVYVLANYKGVERLQTLALRRLLLVLSRLQPLRTRSHIAGNVAEFAGYVYANTALLSGSEEPLRKITSHFIAVNVVAFQNEPRAVKLMAEGGDLVTDVMAKLCRRIVDPEDGCAGSGSPRKRYISGIKVSTQQ